MGKSSPKKKKLSLSSNKKHASEKTEGNQTIFTMFKKQQERLSHGKVDETNDGEEDLANDAVIITRVEKSMSGSIMSDQIEGCRTEQNDDSSVKNVKNSDQKRLSLSKQKSKGKKLTKNESTFAVSEKKKTCTTECKPSKSSYKLRTRKTVPLVADSDSDEENESDNEDVVITGSSDTRVNAPDNKTSVYFGMKERRYDTKTSSSRRLSLKRHRTAGDAPLKVKVQRMTVSEKANKLETQKSKRTEDSNKDVADGAEKADNSGDNDDDVMCVSNTNSITSAARSSKLMKQKDRLKLKSPPKAKDLTDSKKPSESSLKLKITESDDKKSQNKKSVGSKLGADNDCLDNTQLHMNDQPTGNKGVMKEYAKSEDIIKDDKKTKSKTMVKTMKEESKVNYPNSKKNKDTGKSTNADSDEDQMADDESISGDTGDKLQEGAEQGPYRIPYFLENFRTIMNSVLEDEYNSCLFNDQDLLYIDKFKSLTEPCQKLYIRIFSRKLSWLPVTRLSYPEISDDIPGLVSQLIETGLLHSGDKLQDLKTVLGILSAPDLKSLAKSFHLNVTTVTKPKLLEMLEKKSQQNPISSMFTGGRGTNMEKTMLDRARTYLGQVCRLVDEARAVYMRLLMLFSLYHTNYDEDSNNSGQGQQLFQMLMVNIGRVVYPSYTVNRQRAVFADRAALVRFETALQFEMDLQTMTEKGRWVEAYDLYMQADKSADDILQDENMKSLDSTLPEYLRLYTAGSVYIRIRHAGVEILQRRRDYNGAVALLRSLIDQALYCPHYRGHWYERLTLNLDAHLKSPGQCLSTVNTALLDPTVRAARRLAVYERGRKICEAPRSKYADQLKELEKQHKPVSPTPETSIEGMVLSDAGQMGVKYQFVMEGGSDGVTLCAVEELVLDYYKHHGYTDGLHAEGSIISNLCMLLLWDIVYMPIADVFYSPYQACPLDITTQDFYLNRKDALDTRLTWIREATTEDLCAEVEKVWESHNGTQCMGLNWDRFSGPDTHKGLLCCMGGKVIAGILERFVKDPRHTRSGFPDLTLWNTDTRQFKICEVKGPTDRLSYKQILWIDYLIKLGVDAEVCYVKAVGSKKLKPASSK